MSTVVERQTWYRRPRNAAGIGCLSVLAAVLLCGVILWGIPQVGNTIAQNRAEVEVFATLTAMAPSSTSNCPQGQVEVSYQGAYPVDFGCQEFAVATQVAMAQAQLNGAVATATPSNAVINGVEFNWQQLEAMGTVMPTGTNEAGSLQTQWFTGADLAEAGVVSVKPGRSDCLLGSACNILGEPGVLGADKLEDADRNPSAIWTGGNNHYICQDANGQCAVLVPEGSYVTAFANSFRVTGGGMDIVLPSCGENCGWGLVIRGLHLGDGDLHLPLVLSEYGAPGAASVTRYPVPAGSGEYFSEDYAIDQIENALGFDNCGATGCGEYFLATIDYNDKSMTVLRFFVQDRVLRHEVMWTNLAQ